MKERLAKGTPLWEQLNWLLNTEQISLRAANGKFDLNWTHEMCGIDCSNFKFDTMLVGSLLDENRGNALDLHTKWYCPDLAGYSDEADKKWDKGRMDLIPPEQLLPYAGGDADATLRVSLEMRRELLLDPGLTKFYVHVLHPAARAFEHVERTGMRVDVPAYLQVESEVKIAMAKAETAALKVVGGRLCAKYADNLSLGRPALIKDFLFGTTGLNLTPKMFTEKSKEPSTSADHIEMFEHEPAAVEFMKHYSEWAQCKKTLSTYIAKRDEDGNIIGGFLSHLRPGDVFHPNYFLFNGGDDDGGTNTGRLSARDPAVQTIPKHRGWAKRLRACYIAPPGYLVHSADYSQGELKIAACLAYEQAMIQAYLEGIDLHAMTAAAVGGYDWNAFVELGKTDPDKYDLLRQGAKACNFGFLYGMGAEGFMAYAWATYGVKFTLAEAEAAREAFFKRYPALVAWHEKYKRMAREAGFVRSPLGRVRHLPLINSPDRMSASKSGRQAINSPVQGTLSDLNIWAAGIFWQNGWHTVSPVIGAIHDQLLSYIPEENWRFYAGRNKRVMENLPMDRLGWKPQLKFTTDCEVGPNLGSLKKFKDIAYA
jgi:DNA polymerase I-like protein with 3'-5' exonuclease and polymerase domains